MASHTERDECTLEIKDEEVSIYECDFRIPPKIRIKENISKLPTTGYTFANMKFKTGILAGVNHHWGLSLYANQVNIRMSLPRRTESKAYTLHPATLQLLDDDTIKSNDELGFQNHYPGDQSDVWVASWVNGGSWTDATTSMRIKFCVSVEHAGKCTIGPQDKKRLVKDNTNLGAFNFFLSEELSDIKIKCGTATFPAHRFLLACKSPVFGSMFQHNMKECTQGLIEIEDVNEDVLRDLLRFLYTGEIELEKTTVSVEELLIASEKYMISDLKSLCEDYLLTQVAPENALEMYALGDTYSAQNLLDKSLDTLRLNKRTIALDAETFKFYVNKYPNLMFELYSI